MSFLEIPQPHEGFDAVVYRHGVKRLRDRCDAGGSIGTYC
jgi:hypothetical protein